MKTYIITYDLLNPGRSYDSLYARIKSLGEWGKITESSWAVLSGLDEGRILNRLRPALDANDTIFVGTLGSCEWVNLHPDVGGWLRSL